MWKVENGPTGHRAQHSKLRSVDEYTQSKSSFYALKALSGQTHGNVISN